MRITEDANSTLTFATSEQGIEIKGISELILFQDRLVLLLNPRSSGEKNIQCFDLAGKLIWTIADPVRVQPLFETYFVGMAIRNDNLFIYSKDGVEYEVAIDTGDFNKYVLIK